MSKDKRPLSITIIAGLFFLSGLFSILSIVLCFIANDLVKYYLLYGYPLFLYVCLKIVSLAFSCSIGIGLLKGKNWGRLLCLWYIPMSYLLKLDLESFHFYRYQLQLVITGLTCVVFLSYLIILTRPKAVVYFKSKASN